MFVLASGRMSNGKITEWSPGITAVAREEAVWTQVSTNEQVEHYDVWLGDYVREIAKQKLVIGFGELNANADGILMQIENDVNSIRDKWMLRKSECVTAYSSKCHMAINPIPPNACNSALVGKLTPVLLKLQECREGIHFLAPVDPVVFPDMLDYYDVIKRPMDLHTIHSKLAANKYATEFEFFHDVWLVLSNAWKYYDNRSYICTYACTLSTVLLHCMEKLLKDRFPIQVYYSKTFKRLSKNLSVAEYGAVFGRAVTHSDARTVVFPSSTPPLKPAKLEKLGEHAIRRVPGTQAAYFIFAPGLQLMGMQQIQLFRLSDPDTTGTVSLEELLVHKYSTSPYFMGCVIDEVAGKVYLAAWIPCHGGVAFKPYLQRAWLDEYELQLPKGTIRARQIKIDLKHPTIMECHLFIQQNSGSLMAYVAKDDVENKKEMPLVAALLQRRKSDRVLFAHYVHSTLSSDVQLGDAFCLMQHKYNGIDCLTAVFNCRFEKGVAPVPWLFLTIRMSKGLPLELIREQSLDPSTLWCGRVTQSLNGYDFCTVSKVLGKIFKVMVIACYFPVLPPRLIAVRLKHIHGKAQSVVCAVALKQPFQGYGPIIPLVSVNASSLLLAHLDKAAVSRVHMRGSASRQFKFYRFCANCGKRERKKRTNGEGKRISDFKVCRECKKLNFHQDFQNRSCHFCSFECIKQDWKKHASVHHQLKQVSSTT